MSELEKRKGKEMRVNEELMWVEIVCAHMRLL